MTPSEHYAEAERLLEVVEKARREVAHEEVEEGAVKLAAADLLLEEAKVHATLATVDPTNLGRRPPPMVAAHSEAP